jgi:hypothetical protein
MRFFKRFFAKASDPEVDAVLAGRQTGGELDDVATFFRELRENLVEVPSAALEATHLAAISEATRLAPSSVTQQRPRNRRFAARTTIAAVGLAIMAAFGGAAYAGVLPDGVQGKVADIAGNVGVSLPGHDHPKKHNNVEQPRTTTQPTVSDPGQAGGDQSGGGTQGEGTQTGPDQTGGANQNDGGSQNGGDTGNQPGANQGSGDGQSSGKGQGSGGGQGDQTTTTDPVTPDGSGGQGSVGQGSVGQGSVGQGAGNGGQGGSSGDSGSVPGDQNNN